MITSHSFYGVPMTDQLGFFHPQFSEFEKILSKVKDILNENFSIEELDDLIGEENSFEKLETEEWFPFCLSVQSNQYVLGVYSDQSQVQERYKNHLNQLPQIFKDIISKIDPEFLKPSFFTLTGEF